ncbi:hypothetical protein J6590_048507 [Homalodisca vitripennis]|nr:hypothetical protein J6590_048507 [Homalodisca vitripennis]
MSSGIADSGPCKSQFHFTSNQQRLAPKFPYYTCSLGNPKHLEHIKRAKRPRTVSFMRKETEMIGKYRAERLKRPEHGRNTSCDRLSPRYKKVLCSFRLTFAPRKGYTKITIHSLSEGT